MSKESIYSPEPNRCIFRETFNSEADVRKNGGVPTNVTFQNGVGVLDGTTSYITYKISLNGVYSVRIKYKNNINNALQRFFLDSRGLGATNGIGYFYQTNGVVTISSGICYINAVPSTSVSLNISEEIVVAGISLICKDFITVGRRSSDTRYWASDIELFEIYNYALSAQEISNMFSNKRLKAPVLDKDEQLGPELVDQNAWYTMAYWDLVASPNWSQVGNTLVSNGSTGTLRKASLVSSGKKYKITITVNLISGALTAPFYDYQPLIISASGTYSYYYSPIASTRIQMYSDLFSGAITALSIKEVLVNRTRVVLDVNAFGGVVKNRLSGNPYTELITNGGIDTDWVDTDGNGLADGWGISNFVTAYSSTIITDPDFNGRAQKVMAITAGGANIVYLTKTSVFTQNKTYRITGRVKSTYMYQLYVGQGNQLILSKTFNGVENFDITFTSTSTGTDLFLATKSQQNGDYCIWDQISVKEIIPQVVNTNISIANV